MHIGASSSLLGEVAVASGALRELPVPVAQVAEQLDLVHHFLVAHAGLVEKQVHNPRAALVVERLYQSATAASLRYIT